MTENPANALVDLAAGYWKSAALQAAVELGVCEALEAKGRTSVELAAELAVSASSLEMLLDALASLGLLVKEAGRYSIASAVAPFLSTDSERSLLPALRLNADLYQLWGKLAECVRAGAPVLPQSAFLGADAARTRRFALGMHSRAIALSRDVLPHLQLNGARNLLDVGAGVGAFSRLLARREPELRVTLLDLPPVLEIAAELNREDPAAERIALHPADYRNGALPAGFDAVLFSGALHQETPDGARALFGKMLAALHPGGRLFVLDFMLENDRTGPPFSALFALNMLLVSSTARVYSGEQVVQLLAEGRFEEARCERLPGSPFRLVTARKPERIAT